MVAAAYCVVRRGTNPLRWTVLAGSRSVRLPHQAHASATCGAGDGGCPAARAARIVLAPIADQPRQARRDGRVGGWLRWSPFGQPQAAPIGSFDRQQPAGTGPSGTTASAYIFGNGGMNDRRMGRSRTRQFVPGGPGGGPGGPGATTGHSSSGALSRRAGTTAGSTTTVSVLALRCDGLFGDSMGAEISWLLPAALFSLICVPLATTRRAARTDSAGGTDPLWGSWLLVGQHRLPAMKGIMHAYYTIALAPAVAALVEASARDRTVERTGSGWCWRS